MLPSTRGQPAHLGQPSSSANFLNRKPFVRSVLLTASRAMACRFGPGAAMRMAALHIGGIYASRARGDKNSPDINPACLVAIRMQEINRALSANYTRLLDEIVFYRSSILEDNRKEAKSLKRVLTNEEANNVLSILWRESPHVSDNELGFDEFSKLFPQKQLTTYHLAVHLAGSKHEVAATNSRVRLIVAAGAVYGLVTKRQLTRTKVYIIGTELLHDFMVQLGLENANSCAQILWRNGGAHVSPESLLSIPFMWTHSESGMAKLPEGRTPD
jgi:hypothetical protein